MLNQFTHQVKETEGRLKIPANTGHQNQKDEDFLDEAFRKLEVYGKASQALLQQLNSEQIAASNIENINDEQLNDNQNHMKKLNSEVKQLESEVNQANAKTQEAEDKFMNQLSNIATIVSIIPNLEREGTPEQAQALREIESFLSKPKN